MSSRTNPVQKIVEVMSTLKATNSVTNRALMTILKLPFQNQLLGKEFSKKKPIHIFTILGIFFTKILPFIYRIRVDAEVEAMKLWDFISSFGGNLGLFLGGSIVWMSEKIFIQLPNSMQKFRSN